MPISGCRTENCVVFEENRTAEKKIALSIEEIRRRKKRTKYNKENAPAQHTDLSGCYVHISSSRQVVLKKIADRLVEQLGVDESEVTPEASFKDDLAADSIDLFEMVMSLEDEYDIEIPTDRLEEIETVGDLMEVLEELGIEE